MQLNASLPKELLHRAKSYPQPLSAHEMHLFCTYFIKMQYMEKMVRRSDWAKGGRPKVPPPAPHYSVACTTLHRTGVPTTQLTAQLSTEQSSIYTYTYTSQLH